MGKNILSSFIPILRSDCKFRRISNNRFEVFVNERKEFIDLEKNLGDLLEAIIPLINGRRTIRKIVQLISRQHKSNFSIEDVNQIITNLFKWGLISDCTRHQHLREITKNNYSPLQISYLGCFTTYPIEMQKKLQKVCIALMGAKYISPIILRSLYLSGIRHVKLIGNHIMEPEEIPFFISSNCQAGMFWHKALSEEASSLGYSINLEIITNINNRSLFKALKNVDLILVLLPKISPKDVREINKICLETNTRLLFGGLSSSKIIIGPFVIPFQSACFTCRELRDKEKYSFFISETASKIKEDYSYYTKFNNIDGILNPFLVSYANILTGYACLHILGISTLLINHEIEIDFYNAMVTEHFILKLPRCPACSYQARNPEHKILKKLK